MASDKVKQAELRAQGLYSLGPDSWTYSLSYEESLGGKKNYLFLLYAEWVCMCWYVCGRMNVCRWVCTWHVEAKS